MNRPSHAALLTMIHMGQLTDAQVAAELRDPEFAAYWRASIGPEDPAIPARVWLFVFAVSAVLWALVLGVVL